MNFKKLNQQAANYRKSPEKEVWRRLNMKLSENSEQPRSFFISKPVRYVASFLLLTVSVGALYFSEQNITIPKPVFESSFQESNADGIYSSDKMNDLYIAYRKMYVSKPNTTKEI